MTPSDAAQYRARMVSDQLVDRGIRAANVLAAFGRVPRERFVPEAQTHRAYEDAALPIASRQTISQPYIVALACESLGLTGQEKVLEIGTGSGYQTAILASLAKSVFTVERLPELAGPAAERLAALGVQNVTQATGDGTRGWASQAPFDAIVVAAASPRVPPQLLEQLALRGRLVIPVGDLIQQELMLVERKDSGWTHRAICPCAFVPLLGEGAWQKKDEG